MSWEWFAAALTLVAAATAGVLWLRRLDRAEAEAAWTAPPGPADIWDPAEVANLAEPVPPADVPDLGGVDVDLTDDTDDALDEVADTLACGLLCENPDARDYWYGRARAQLDQLDPLQQREALLAYLAADAEARAAALLHVPDHISPREPR